MNPLIISRGMAVKNWLAKNTIEVLKTYKSVQKAKDGATWLAIFEFSFSDQKQAEMFMNMYELAKSLEL